jgi:hypothetical protein
MTYELKTTEYKGQKITIKTNIGTLKEVWNILKEVNLDGLLTGGNLEISFNEIVDSLLTEGALESFCNIIVADNSVLKNVDDLELTDIVGIISLFFTSIAQPFQGLNIAVSKQQTAEQTTV